MTTTGLPRHIPAIAVAILFLLSFHSINTQNLTATISTARLPTGRNHIAAWYDNDDSIYLFGGYNRSFAITETFKYSISSDTLENAGDLPMPTLASHIIQNKFGDIYHLSGDNADDIYQYFPGNQSFTNVSSIPLQNSYFGTIHIDEEDTALLFGGVNYECFGVQRMNLSNLSFEKINDVPERMFAPTGIWVKDSAYIFGGREIYKYHRSANQFEGLPIGSPFRMDGGAKAVSDGKYGYIIGGVNYFHDNIFRFDWESETLEPVRMLGHPFVGNGDVYLAAPAAVYVEKVNRIYLFGGYTVAPIRFRAEIWYINLD